MTKSRNLSPEDRSFFTLVNRAVFANPFTRERSDLDLEISGLKKAASDVERLEKALAKVSERIDALEAELEAIANELMVTITLEQ